MSYITKAENGLKAAQAGNHEEALKNLNVALKEATSATPNPAWLLTRCRSLVATSRFAEALADAEVAFHSAYSRNSRPMMQEAQYRRAVCHHRLSQPADAAACCVFAIRLAKSKPAVEKGDVLEDVVDDKGFWKQTVEEVKAEVDADPWSNKSPNEAMSGTTGASGEAQRGWKMACMMRLQALLKLEGLPADDEKRRVTVSQKPEMRELADIKVGGGSSDAKITTTPAAAPKPAADTPPRMDEYQTTTHMNVSIFSKGNSKDELKVEFGAAHVSLDPLVHPNGSKKAFRLDLWGEIEAEGSKYTVTPSKVELTLKKKSVGKWAQLRGEGKNHATAPVELAKPQTTAAPPTETVAQSKPSSSGTASFSKWYNKEVEVDGEEDEDESDVNGFFKKLYKGATPEQQRAMVKSFTESSGTSLSTDWNDVGSRHVAPAPPDGAEAKEWEK